MKEKAFLTKLLETGDLDIKSLAAADHQLTLDEFLGRIEYFLVKTPAFVDTLNRTVTVGDTNAFLGQLTEISKLLRIIGSHKREGDISALRTAVSNNDFRNRNLLIKKLSEDLTILGEKIKKIITHDSPYKDLSEKTGSVDIYVDKAVQRLESPHDEAAITLVQALADIPIPYNHVKPMILAVDDMSDVLVMVKAVLGEQYEVFSLKKGEHVEKFLEVHTPDLFILDIEMPGMDGYELIGVIRSLEKHRFTPIIFLTSNATFDYLKNAVDLGVSDFIKKPFDKDLLLERVRLCLNNR